MSLSSRLHLPAAAAHLRPVPPKEEPAAAVAAHEAEERHLRLRQVLHLQRHHQHDAPAAEEERLRRQGDEDRRGCNDIEEDAPLWRAVCNGHAIGRVIGRAMGRPPYLVDDDPVDARPCAGQGGPVCELLVHVQHHVAHVPPALGQAAAVALWREDHAGIHGQGEKKKEGWEE